MVALALCVLLSMPQGAYAQGAPDERAAAREFADAAYRLRVRIRRIRARGAPGGRRGPRRARRRTAFPGEAVDAGRLPRRVQDPFGLVFQELELGVAYGVVSGHYATFVAELDRVPTAVIRVGGRPGGLARERRAHRPGPSASA